MDNEARDAAKKGELHTNLATAKRISTDKREGTKIVVLDSTKKEAAILVLSGRYCA